MRHKFQVLHGAGYTQARLVVAIYRLLRWYALTGSRLFRENDHISFMDLQIDIVFLYSADKLVNTSCPMRDNLQRLRDENQELKAAVELFKSRIEQLEAQLGRNSSNSNKPPSSDSPFTPKPREKQVDQPPKTKAPRMRKGVRQQCLRPAEIKEIFPAPCSCGCTALRDPEPYSIHQYVQLPPILPDVEHCILYRGHCADCGARLKALIPSEKRFGYGPRRNYLTAPPNPRA